MAYFLLRINGFGGVAEPAPCPKTAQEWAQAWWVHREVTEEGSSCKMATCFLGMTGSPPGPRCAPGVTESESNQPGLEAVQPHARACHDGDPRSDQARFPALNLQNHPRFVAVQSSSSDQAGRAAGDNTQSSPRGQTRCGRPAMPLRAVSHLLLEPASPSAKWGCRHFPPRGERPDVPRPPARSEENYQEKLKNS